MVKLAKQDLKVCVISDFASLKTVYVELYARGKRYAEAMHKAEQVGDNELATKYRKISQRLFGHAHQIWPKKDGIEYFALPVEDWEPIYEGEV